MFGFLSPDRLARRSANHPWLTIGIWVLVIVAAFGAASQLSFDESSTISGTESAKAENLMKDGFGGQDSVNETIVIQHPTLTVDDPAYQAFVANVVSDLRGLNKEVTGVVSYFETPDAQLVSADRHKTILPVGLTGELLDAPVTVEPVLAALKANSGQGFTVQAVGDGSLGKALGESFEKDLQRAEMLGLPVALVVLVIVFGAGVAAGLPVILSLLGIFISVGLTALLSKVFGVGSIVINMITMIGLAVGIDYTLFIIERFRDERAAGRPKLEAIAAAGNTASRAVLFSGITVVIAMAGMLIVPASEFKGISLGAITSVVGAVAVALTLLPALLSLIGDRVNWLTLPGRGKRRSHEDTGGFFGKTTALVTRHPVISVVASVVVLLAAAAPYATIKLGDPGLNDFPANLEPIQAFKVLDKDFSAGRLAPTHVVIEGNVNSPAVAQAVDELRASLRADASFTQSSDLETNSTSTIGVVNVLLKGDSIGPDAVKAVERLRNTYIPQAFDGTGATVSVGGATAETVDYVDTMTHYLPIVVAFVLTLSFLLLMMVFRSIVIPVKAIIMNLLSVGAAYGLLVLVFQKGVGNELMGFQQTESIAAFLPIFLFAVLFGLSMDYHVFLLSRIHERYLKTGDNGEAVGYGLRSTAHIITGAAAIMMVVFGGFAMGEMVALQQVGFGLAVAVFLDATIVRSVLVPASMELLGSKNWYLPSWLQWLPEISVEGRHEEPATAPTMDPSFGYAAASGGGQ